MSTFRGYFDDIKFISVDRFNGSENLKSRVYFLSHCHTDHMVGLETKEFQNRLLQNEDIYLYASSVSVQILIGTFPLLEPKLKVLPLKYSTLIEIPQTDNNLLSVTPIPAGHCPGSVMFLFEANINILYTGDIRLDGSELTKYKNLFNNSGQQKSIDIMYLDTTFFSKTYKTFPCRIKTLEALINKVNHWLSEDNNNIISLVTSAKYGHEFLFCGLSKSLKMPIHVNEEVYNLYKYIPEMDKCITLDGSITKLHASCVKYKEICKKDNVNICSIKSCAMSWQDYKDSDLLIQPDKSKVFDYKICYSCHSSYDELLDLIYFFKPSVIKSSVIPSNNKDKENLYLLLEEAHNTYSKSEITALDKSALQDTKLFPVENAHCSDTIDNEMVLNDLLDSPPRVYKKLRF